MDDLEQRITRIEAAVERLTRAFNEHRHTGLDSKTVDLTDQIESQGSLTAADGSTVDTTYGAEEAAVIENNRTRITQIETALQGFGILE